MERELVIRPAQASELIDLRHAVLRARLPRESAIFAGDELPTTRHFVATVDGRIVGCVTLLLNEWNDEPAWQLRGMAVEPGMQGSGIGAKLLAAAEESTVSSPTQLLWCNARVPASKFYQKRGWELVSEQFDIPTAGPHVKMLKRITRSVR
jgi:predicted GNAT family N-acyltransferase